MGESRHVARGRMRALREDPNADEELEGMNRGKAGAPYRYAGSPFMVPAPTRFTSHMSYECLEGYAREMPGELNAPRRARTCGRINAPKADIRDGVATVCRGARAVRPAADASGLQQHNRGEWIRKKRRHKRGSVDPHTGGHRHAPDPGAARDRRKDRRLAGLFRAARRGGQVPGCGGSGGRSGCGHGAARRGRRRGRRRGDRRNVQGLRGCGRHAPPQGPFPGACTGGLRFGGGDRRGSRRRTRDIRGRRIRLPAEPLPVQRVRGRTVHQAEEERDDRRQRPRRRMGGGDP